MINKCLQVDFFDSKNVLKVSVESILRALGMKLADADEYLIGLINESIKICTNLAEPSVDYIIVDNPLFDREKRVSVFNGVTFDTGKVVTGFLFKSTKVLLFAATIGPDVEQWSKKQMQQGNTLEGYIADLIGSELAESTIEHFHNCAQKTLIDCGLKVTNRFSPGYCNWPVSNQHKLFSLLGEHSCGIQLTDSSLMLPVKSVSGVFGIGPNVIRAPYKCNICTDTKCILRIKNHK